MSFLEQFIPDGTTIERVLTITCSCVIGTFVTYHTVKQALKKPFEKNGYYEIIPLAKCLHLTDKTKELLNKEKWGKIDTGHPLNLSPKAIMPINLILVHYKDKNTSPENKQDIDEIKVIGHVYIKGRIKEHGYRKTTESLTIERLMIDPDYRGFGFGKSLMMASYKYVDKFGLVKLGVKKFAGMAKNKGLIEFYKYFGAIVDFSLIYGSDFDMKKAEELKTDFFYMYINLDDKTLIGKADKYLNQKKKTHNLIVTL